MRRLTSIVVVAALVAAGCASTPQPPKGSKRFAASQTISANYDPSVSGLPGSVGDIVSVAGGATAWVKSGTGVTDWVAFPGSGGAGTVTTNSTLTGDGSEDSPLGVNDTSWFATETAAAVAAIPEITDCIPVQMGIANVGEAFGSSAADAAKEGGCVKGIAGTVSYVNRAMVYQNMKTSKFWVSFDGSFASIASSQTSYFGLYNGTTGAQVSFGTDQAQDASQYVLLGYNGASLTTIPKGGAASTARSTYRLFSDATTVTLARNGTTLTTLATSATNFPTAAGSPGWSGSTSATGQSLCRVLYCYVSP